MRSLDGASGRSVIINPAFLGDCVFDGVLARAIKVRNPNAYVGLVVRPPYDGVARFMPHVDAIHVFDKRGARRGLRGLSAMAAELFDGRYDRAYVIHPSVRSARLAQRAKIPERRGFARGWMTGWHLTHRVIPRAEDTFTQERLRLLDEGKTWPQSLTSLRGVLRARKGSDGARVRAGLVIGSEVATKRWPIEHAAKLIDENQHPGWTWVLIGSSKERHLAERLLDHLGGAAVEDRVGEGIGELVPCIAGLDVVVGGDTGPLFIARGLGVPTVGLFGPTPELRHQSSSADHVMTVELACRPCSDHGPRRCPERHHRCLTGLEADRVSKSTRELVLMQRAEGSGGAAGA